MKGLLPYSLFVFLLLSCGKEYAPPLPAEPVDTLKGWQKINTGIDQTLTDIAFVSPAKGFVSAFGLYRSLDSGKTWAPAVSTSLLIITIQFLDARYGYFVGEKIFGYTTDGGDSWKVQESTVPFGSDVFFVDPATGYLGGREGLFRTSDTGRTWQLVHPGNWQALHFTGPQNGWGFKLDAGIQQTADGSNWQKKHHVSNYGNTVFFLDDRRGWVTYRAGFMSRTQDGGATWQEIPLPSSAGFDVQFLTADKGFITMGHRLMQSADGGQTWSMAAYCRDTQFIELFFLDENTGWAAGEKGTVLRWKK